MAPTFSLAVWTNITARSVRYDSSDSVNLRLIVITDRALAHPRPLEHVVREALTAGAPAVQLRDKNADARSLYEQAVVLRRLTREYDALLFVNDRLDVALAAGADGTHIGPNDMPLEAARRAAPAPFLIGWSTDDPEEARRFAKDLKRFNDDTIARAASLQSRFAALGATWQDQEQEKFAEEFVTTMKVLKKCMELSEKLSPYLLRRSGASP